MKFSNDIPAIYHKCHTHFGVNWEHVIITYGDTVYSKIPIRPEKIVHEAVHIEQQKHMDKDEWWHEFIYNRDFRLSQEAEAYRAEIKFIKKKVKDRNHQTRMIHEICTHLSGPMYGNMCTYAEAKKLVT